MARSGTMYARQSPGPRVPEIAPSHLASAGAGDGGSSDGGCGEAGGRRLRHAHAAGRGHSHGGLRAEWQAHPTPRRGGHVGGPDRQLRGPGVCHERLQAQPYERHPHPQREPGDPMPNPREKFNIPAQLLPIFLLQTHEITIQRFTCRVVGCSANNSTESKPTRKRLKVLNIGRCTRRRRRRPWPCSTWRKASARRRRSSQTCSAWCSALLERWREETGTKTRGMQEAHRPADGCGPVCLCFVQSVRNTALVPVRLLESLGGSVAS